MSLESSAHVVYFYIICFSLWQIIICIIIRAAAFTLVPLLVKILKIRMDGNHFHLTLSLHDALPIYSEYGSRRMADYFSIPNKI